MTKSCDSRITNTNSQKNGPALRGRSFDLCHIFRIVTLELLKKLDMKNLIFCIYLFSCVLMVHAQTDIPFHPVVSTIMPTDTVPGITPLIHPEHGTLSDFLDSAPAQPGDTVELYIHPVRNLDVLFLALAPTHSQLVYSDVTYLNTFMQINCMNALDAFATRDTPVDKVIVFCGSYYTSHPTTGLQYAPLPEPVRRPGRLYSGYYSYEINPNVFPVEALDRWVGVLMLKRAPTAKAPE